MVIEFLCPNGHKIRCGEERAGRAAKCPKCGEKFLVPDLSEIRVTTGADVPQGPEVGSGPIAPREDAGQIQFLCPNGHQLSATSEAQGTPGQCPHCGSKFHVPRLEGASGEAFPESSDRARPIATPPDGRGLPPLASAGPPDAFATDVGDSGETYEAVLVEDTEDDTELAHSPEPTDPSLDLLGAIWREKQAGAIVELHLADGETLVPDHYAASLSRGRHALFAVVEPDGSHTLTAIAWETITRIRTTGVKRLPEGF